MEVIDLARGTPGGAYVPRGNCIQRFHSCTGNQDKIDVVANFASRKVPLISCTMALGLGQNWKRVRMVVHMGQGDRALICQMIGRCGRDRRPGLALMFVEKTRRKGKNLVEQFTQGATQDNADGIDALAITPVCLRIAFSLDNLLGYVPLWEDDEAYIAEQQREVSVNMPQCCCSNCAPSEAACLMQHLLLADKGNFDKIMSDNFTTSLVRDIKSKYPTKRTSYWKRKYNENEEVVVNTFKEQLLRDLHAHYNAEFGIGGPISAEDIFGEQEAEAVVSYLNHITGARDLQGIIGGECFEGQLEWLMQKVLRLKELLALTPAGTTAKRVRKSNGRKSIPTITATGAPGPTPDSAALARLQVDPLLQVSPTTKSVDPRLLDP
ncbi:hypothetical protein PSTG_12869 [Puccinia striiformis f. sp. tritici PST-78]|uniref:DNA 3'-5' helicase n=2 Tax=Puccinia striiformis f. sp. tritici TaxID=168172 RepID=A0A0L0V3K8_9BASI|nr:hypothetical protein PSTG_12869 [Puccinia striiformis f. sp. tritici PST-78]